MAVRSGGHRQSAGGSLPGFHSRDIQPMEDCMRGPVAQVLAQAVMETVFHGPDLSSFHT